MQGNARSLSCASVAVMQDNARSLSCAFLVRTCKSMSQDRKCQGYIRIICSLRLNSLGACLTDFCSARTILDGRYVLRPGWGLMQNVQLNYSMLT